MKLLLKRIALKPTYTIGWLYIDGQKVCDNIEDDVRDLNKNGRFDNGEKKVYAATAIPYGTYDITLKVQSPKYKDRAQYKFCDGYLPRLLNVPEFDGILIHIGNTAEDSAGCILVGENKEVGKVLNSTATFRRVSPCGGSVSATGGSNTAPPHSCMPCAATTRRVFSRRCSIWPA